MKESQRILLHPIDSELVTRTPLPPTSPTRDPACSQRIRYDAMVGSKRLLRGAGYCESIEYDRRRMGLPGARKALMRRRRRAGSSHAIPTSVAGFGWRSRCCSDFRPLVWRFGVFIGG